MSGPALPAKSEGARLGPEKAITATAHKLARILFDLITTREPYNEAVFAKAEQKLRRHQEAKLRTTAQRMGLRLIPLVDSPGSPVPNAVVS
jgi:hypothetical protein